MIQGNNEYRIIQRLGRGNYGTALLVERNKDQLQCVIKQIEMSAMSEDEKKDTLKEAKTLQMLKHSNIIKYYDHFKTKKGRLCIVMEYAAGGDLSQIIQGAKSHISEEQILIWLGQLASALSYLHRKNIIHRDIKAQNIFLSVYNDVKLADFGIATILSSTKERAQTFIGTPYYLAPEQVDSKPYTTAVDIWSLGVLIYQLCTLKPPFDAENIPMLYLKISRGQFPPLPTYYSKELRALVGEMLTVDPILRITAAQILEKPLLKGRVDEMIAEVKPFKERLSMSSSNNIMDNASQSSQNQQEQQQLFLSEPPKIPRMGLQKDKDKQQNNGDSSDKNIEQDKKVNIRVRTPVPKVLSPSSSFTEIKQHLQDKQSDHFGQKIQPHQQQQQPKLLQNIPRSTTTSSSNNLEVLPSVPQIQQEIPNISGNYIGINSPGTRLPFLNHFQPYVFKKAQHCQSQCVPGGNGFSNNIINNIPSTPQSNQIKRNSEKLSFSRPSCFMNNNNELPSPKILGNNSNNLRPTSALVGITSNNNLLRKQQLQQQQEKQEQQGNYDKSEQSPHYGQFVMPLGSPPQLFKKDSAGFGDAPLLLSFEGALSLARQRENLKSASNAIATASNNNNNIKPVKIFVPLKNNHIIQNIGCAPDNLHSPVELQPLELLQLNQEQEQQQEQQQQQRKKKTNFLIKKTNVNISQSNLLIKNLNNRVNDPDDIISIMQQNVYQPEEEEQQQSDQNELNEESNICEATQQIKITQPNNSLISDLKTAKKLNLISNSKQIVSQPSLEKYDKNEILHPKRGGSGSFALPQVGISPLEKIMCQLDKQQRDEQRMNSSNNQEDLIEQNKAQQQHGQQLIPEHQFALQKNYYSHDYDKGSKVERKIIVNDPFQEIKKKRKNTDVSQKEEIASENDLEERGSAVPKIKENKRQQGLTQNNQGNATSSVNDNQLDRQFQKLDAFNDMKIDSLEEEYKEDFLEEGNDIDDQDDSEHFNDSRIQTFTIDQSAMNGGSNINNHISIITQIANLTKISNDQNDSLKSASSTHASNPSVGGNTPESNKASKNNNNNNNNNNNSMNEQPLSHFQQFSQQQKQQNMSQPQQSDRVKNLREQLEKEIGTIHFSKVYELAVEAVSSNSSPSMQDGFSQSLKVMFPSISKEFLQRYTTLFYSLVLLDQHN